MNQTADKTRRVRELNDAFRKTMARDVFLTRGVADLPSDVRATALRRVATFAAFSTDNDPYHEHDFGSFDLAGNTFFFKIDYYAPDREHGSDDPSDPAKTLRILTIMLAEEY